MKKLLEYIVKGLVKNPQKVRIVEKKGENEQPIFIIKTADEDKGIVIGKGGRVINAIRTIISIKARSRTEVKVE